MRLGAGRWRAEVLGLNWLTTAVSSSSCLRRDSTSAVNANIDTRRHSIITDRLVLYSVCFNSMTPTVAMATATCIKHSLPDQVEPSCVIFDKRALLLLRSGVKCLHITINQSIKKFLRWPEQQATTTRTHIETHLQN